MKIYGVLFALVLVVCSLQGQDPMRFRSEIERFKEMDQELDYQDLTVFTGSSSVRFWNSLEKDFAEYNAINRGFGGSQFSDLIYFSDQLIRSSCGAALNYGEAQGAESLKDGVHKTAIVLKELKESRVALKILHYINFGPPDQRTALLTEAEELIAISATMIKNKKNKM